MESVSARFLIASVGYPALHPCTSTWYQCWSFFFSCFPFVHTWEVPIGNIDKMMKTSQELQKLHFTSYPLPVLVGNNWWCLNITSYYLPELVMKLTGKSSSNVRSVSPLWLVCPVCPHDYPDYHDSNDDYDEHGDHHSTDESSLSP